MKSLSYSLVTPSYWRDLEQCRILVESVDRWVSTGVTHYLVIASRDVTLFRPLQNHRTEIIVVEDIIPKWLMRLPGMKRFWLSLRTRPVKNWILQQIVKLSVPAAVTQDVLLYADSDMFFVRPHDPRELERDGLVPLFDEVGQRGLIENNDRWQGAAARMLGLPVQTDCDHNYINQLITWRRENVISMLEQIREVTGKDWPLTVASLSQFSEYILYGVYAARVLGERSHHWHDGLIRTLNYWGTQTLDLAALEKLKASRQPHHHSVMISAKSDTPIDLIRQVFLR